MFYFEQKNETEEIRGALAQLGRAQIGPGRKATSRWTTLPEFLFLFVILIIIGWYRPGRGLLVLESSPLASTN